MPPGYPGYPPPQPPPHPHLPAQSHPQLAPSEAAKPTTNTASKPGESTSDADRDAYEAAQNILKAINFGDLLQIAQQGSNGKKPDDVSADQLTSLLIQAQNAISQDLQRMDVVQAPPPPIASLPTLSATAGVAVAADIPFRPPANLRAELQAQLALLAAQLADLGQENGETGLPTVQPQAPPPVALSTQSQELPQQAEEQPLTSAMSTSTAPDFEQPIMDSLLPPVEYSMRQPQSQPLAPPQQPGPPYDSRQAPRLDSIPPVILPATETPMTELVHESPSTNLEPSLLAAPTVPAPTAVSPLPAPILAPVDSQPQSQQEALPPVVTPNFVSGEDESNDDDMEEII